MVKREDIGRENTHRRTSRLSCVSIWFSPVVIDGNNIGQGGVTLDQNRNNMQILIPHASRTTQRKTRHDWAAYGEITGKGH
eukprot:scaffold663_cov129-Skeletonema_dohrnii-CCMP3373.AAC.4